MEKIIKGFFKLFLVLLLLGFMFFNCQQSGNDSSGGGGGSSNDDTTPPTIVSTNPENGDDGIDYNYADLKITFSEDMQTSSISYSISPGIVRVNRWDQGDARTLSIIFQTALAQNTIYEITLNPTGSTNKFMDTAGNALASDTVISFTTGDTTNQPTVDSSIPSDGAVDVDTDNLIITFDQDMISWVSWGVNQENFTHTTEWLNLRECRINFTSSLTSGITYIFYLNCNDSGMYFRNTDNVRLQEDTTITFTTQ